MIAILLPNLYLEGMKLNLKIMNWASVMMVLFVSLLSIYWANYKQDILKAY